MVVAAEDFRSVVILVSLFFNQQEFLINVTDDFMGGAGGRPGARE